jgi:hypothetical protein
MGAEEQRKGNSMWRSRRSIPAALPLLLAASLGLGALGLPAYGQACCGPPTLSLTGAERGIDPNVQLNLGLAYSFYRFSQTVQGSAVVPDPLGRTAVSHQWRLELERPLLPGWSVLLSLPVNLKERRFRVDSLGSSYRAAGIGDASLLLKYQLLASSLVRAWDLALGVGVKAPTGDSKREQDGVRLPRDVQPGTGLWEALLWTAGSVMLPEELLRFTGSALVRIPLHTDEFGYRNGIEAQVQLLASWLGSSLPVVPTLALRFRTSSKDMLNGQPFPATGGAWLDALPMVGVVAEPITLRLQGTVPLFRHTQGLQLAHTWGVTAEVQWTWRR